MTSKRTDAVQTLSLRDAGALPPTEEEDAGEILGDDPKRDVEVMSEPPEIDTTRYDGPPLVSVCGMRCWPCLARLTFVLVVIILLPVMALAACVVLEVVRNVDSFQKVERLISDARNASAQMFDSVIQMASLP